MPKIKVKPIDPNHPRQSTFEYAPVKGEDWDKNYVCLSGFCGPHGPHVFAAAPEMLEALIEIFKLDPTYEDEKYAELVLLRIVTRMGEIARAAIAEAKGVE